MALKDLKSIAADSNVLLSAVIGKAALKIFTHTAILASIGTGIWLNYKSPKDKKSVTVPAVVETTAPLKKSPPVVKKDIKTVSDDLNKKTDEELVKEEAILRLKTRLRQLGFPDKGGYMQVSVEYIIDQINSLPATVLQRFIDPDNPLTLEQWKNIFSFSSTEGYALLNGLKTYFENENQRAMVDQFFEAIGQGPFDWKKLIGDFQNETGILFTKSEGQTRETIFNFIRDLEKIEDMSPEARRTYFEMILKDGSLGPNSSLYIQMAYRLALSDFESLRSLPDAPEVLYGVAKLYGEVWGWVDMADTFIEIEGGKEKFFEKMKDPRYRNDVNATAKDVNSIILKEFPNGLPSDKNRIKEIILIFWKPSPAMLSLKGGIDLDRGKMRMNVNKQGEGVQMQFDAAMIQKIKREGFDGLEFKIESIIPVNLPLFLGLRKEEERLAGV